MVSGWVQRLPSARFRMELYVNVLGCLAIGVLGGLTELRQLLDPAQRLLYSSACSAVSPRSPVRVRSLSLAQNAEIGRALINVLLQIVLCLLHSVLGYAAARSRVRTIILKKDICCASSSASDHHDGMRCTMDRSPRPEHGRRRHGVAWDGWVRCAQSTAYGRILRLSTDLPIVVEIVDTKEDRSVLAHNRPPSSKDRDARNR
jgi:fluoride ion exporter CrcB/FEX